MKKIDLFRGEYYFLSNMYPCRINVNGLSFISSESLYQSFKLLDTEERKQFQSMDGYKAKKFFASRKDLIRPDWHDIKLDVMKLVVYYKFKQNPYLINLLLQTGDAQLIEGNNWGDIFWGVCKNKGSNHLGKILMDLRSQFKSSQLF